MTKIKLYPNDTNISGDDKWLGSDGDNSEVTKNFTVDSVAQYIIDIIEDGGGSPPLSPQIFVTKYVVGAIINGAGVDSVDNIALAVNRSWRSSISVSRNEIVVFEAQRAIAVDEPTTSADQYAYKIVNEQYYYSKGVGTIAQDTTVDDFVLDYSSSLTESITLFGTRGNGQTRPLTGTDTDAPASALNSSATAVTIDTAAKDEFFIVYDNATPTNNTLKAYQFTGASGVYGTGGVLTASPADFTLVPTVTNQALTKTSQLLNDGDGIYPYAAQPFALKKAFITIAATQLNNLGTTPVQIIGTPGAGAFIQIISSAINYTYGTVSYDNNKIGMGPQTGSNAMFASNALGSGSSSFEYFYPQDPDSAGRNTIKVNEGIYLTGTDSVSSGDGTAEIFVQYIIVPITGGGPA